MHLAYVWLNNNKPCPGLLPLILASYGAPSVLWLRDGTLSSEEGVQQGDPLGPLLFSITLQPLLSGCDCELVAGYLDDVGVGDKVEHLISRIQTLERDAAGLCLTLNHSKCEVIGLGLAEENLWNASGLLFAVTP